MVGLKRLSVSLFVIVLVVDITPALPTGENVTINPEVMEIHNANREILKESITPTNGDKWQLSRDDTDSGSSVQGTEGLWDRSGWSAHKKKRENISESLDGWLNSGMVSKDPLLPYRGADIFTRIDNASDEWNELYVKPKEFKGHVSRLNFNERRKLPFHYYHQLHRSRGGSATRNT